MLKNLNELFEKMEGKINPDSYYQNYDFGIEIEHWERQLREFEGKTLINKMTIKETNNLFKKKHPDGHIEKLKGNRYKVSFGSGKDYIYNANNNLQILAQLDIEHNLAYKEDYEAIKKELNYLRNKENIDWEKELFGI